MKGELLGPKGCVPQGHTSWVDTLGLHASAHRQLRYKQHRRWL